MIDSLQKKEFMSFIRLLNSNHLLQHVVVVGSWAEFVYKQTGLLPGFEAMTKTTDVDFLLRNRRQPIPKVSLGSIAKDAGYTIAQDYLLQTTKILTPGNLEVEFLICSRGAGSEIVVDTNFGIKAQSLRDMSVILNNVITLTVDGYNILVPSPEAYAVHKIIINGKRGRKAEKDRQAIINIWPFLSQGKLQRLADGLLKRERASFDLFLQNNNLAA